MGRSEYYSLVSGVLSNDTVLPVRKLSSPDVADIVLASRAPAFLDLEDTLPKLEQSEVEALLAALSGSNAKFLAVMSVYYSDTVLDDGTNENKTVQSHAWWQELVARHFPSSTILRGFQESDVAIANFAISDHARRKIEALEPSGLARELARFGDRLLLAARLWSGSTTGQKTVLDDLAGKRVAVVGNARSLALSEHGSAIDDHDVVVRFNRVPIVSRLSHGFRTDWVASGVPMDGERLGQLGASRLLWMSAFRRKMNRATIRVRDLYLHPPGDIEALSRAIGVERPSTGVTFVDLVRRSACRSVSLFGFDFYASQSSSSHQSIETAPHAFDLEARYIKGLAETDSRFSIN